MEGAVEDVERALQRLSGRRRALLESLVAERQALASKVNELQEKVDQLSGAAQRRLVRGGRDVTPCARQGPAAT